MPKTEAALIATALGLIGREASFSIEEHGAAAGLDPERDEAKLAALRAEIGAGIDPLGMAFSRIRPARLRRALGATYTPPEIVRAMLERAASEAGADAVARIVDPGAGSGRFLLAAAEKFPDAALIGIESDPVAALLLRANLAAGGLSQRARVIVGDYRIAALPPLDGRTLFIGNPPYVRHHDIGPEWKNWFAVAARRYGVKASRLAGLHLHFFLRTLELARPGDLGCFITAAEWLDVNYGAALRALLAGRLGVIALDVFDPKALPFEDAATTGVITHFRIDAAEQTAGLRLIDDVAALGSRGAGKTITRMALASSPRWSALLKPQSARPAGWIELGAICRVHRGQVTGGNAIWIEGVAGRELPERFLHPTVTKARELLRAGKDLVNAQDLRRVIDLPPDLDALDAVERAAVARFLDWVRAQGGDASYIARHRKPWWSVGLKPVAPILCTYMARRPPAFLRNRCSARHINIAHGLYPRETLPDAALNALAAWLRENVTQSSGRTYAGGLTKFEPKELERIALPPLGELAAL
ncbi:MAG TPA: N-6 DNA methylase [Dongiaceae bacterium]